MIGRARARSSAGERFPDTEEVTGSNPVAPTTILARQSAAGAKPGAPPAHLGRAGAARPSAPSSSLALPSPSTPASGSTTTTERSRAPARWQPRGGCGNVALQPAPLAWRRRWRWAPLRRSGLPGRSAAAAPPEHNPARSAADAPPLAYTRPPQRCPQPCLLGAVDRAARDGAGPPGTRLDPVVTAAPAVPRSPPSPPPGGRGRDGCDRADGQTPDGWTPDGRHHTPDTPVPDDETR